MQEIAVNYPLYVIMSLLGVPEADFPLMLSLTQELFGNDDDEFKRAADEGDTMTALLEMFSTSASSPPPGESPPVTWLPRLRTRGVDGQPLNDIEIVSYYAIGVAAAGHDTTSATISGGMLNAARKPG